MGGLFYERLRIFLYANSMSDDQLVKVSRKQLVR
jgi:hypothetical protein